MIHVTRLLETSGNGRAVVRVEGRIVAGPAARRLLERVRMLLRHGMAEVELDLSRVGVLDCGGLGVLLLCRSEARERGARLVVRRSRGATRRMLELSALLGPLEAEEAGEAGAPRRERADPPAVPLV